MERILVTGGAGFIGSHLVDALMKEENNVVVFDNLSSGKLENISQWIGNQNFKFVKGDLLNLNDIKKVFKEYEYDAVFHLAANPEVRVSTLIPKVHFDNNIVATFNLLEAIRLSKIRKFVFASSSTVYGEAKMIPTPENYVPLSPISIYGASKLACEALAISYAHLQNFTTIILRFANIIGPRSKHGVIYDFIIKLKKNPHELEILGDGSQTKSYLYVDDCINAILITYRKVQKGVETFNVGSTDQVGVIQIAKIIIKTLGLKDVNLTFTGGTEDGRGWEGDVKNMLLDVSKLFTLGWKPKYNSEEAVKKTASLLMREVLS
jgi:UDP-glucose 4-epimerase